MGDAYSDSQHMNDGIITVLSRDLAKSPYNLDIIKVIQSTYQTIVTLIISFYYIFRLSSSNDF